MTGKILRTKLNLLLIVCKGLPHQSLAPASLLSAWTWISLGKNHPKIHITVQTQGGASAAAESPILINNPAETVHNSSKDFGIDHSLTALNSAQLQRQAALESLLKPPVSSCPGSQVPLWWGEGEDSSKARWCWLCKAWRIHVQVLDIQTCICLATWCT